VGVTVLHWSEAHAGERIYVQGTAADSITIVLNGRLRSILNHAHTREVVGEFSRGDCIGEIEVCVYVPTHRSDSQLCVSFLYNTGTRIETHPTTHENTRERTKTYQNHAKIHTTHTANAHTQRTHTHTHNKNIN